MGATAGDLLSRDVACRWLTEAGISYDIAVAPPMEGGVDWEAVDPARYTHLLFVCGPLGNGEPATGLFSRFSGCRQIGLNLSMLHQLEEWNPFDLLLERDSSTTAWPDLSLLADTPPVPVVGVILIRGAEGVAGGRHATVHEAIERLVERTELAVVRIDTVLDVPNTSGLRTPAEIESLIARMDAVVTTRLHGGVLALKHGVPALMVDPIEGGTKLRRQAEALGWPALLVAEQADDAALDDGLAWCLTAKARAAAVASTEHGRATLRSVHERFLAEVR